MSSIAASNWNELVNALNFTEADLSANRDGIMTERQLKLFRQKRVAMSIGLIFIFLFAIGIAAIPVTFLIMGLTALTQSFGGFLLFVPAMLFTGVFGAIFSYALLTGSKRDWLAYKYDLNEGVVKHVTGQLTKREVKGRERLWLVIVSSEEFKIKKKVFPYFEQSGAYHVYYTPRTRIILSAERSQETT